MMATKKAEPLTDLRKPRVFWLNQAEWDDLEALAKATGKATRAAVMRDLIHGAKVKVRKARKELVEGL